MEVDWPSVKNLWELIGSTHISIFILKEVHQRQLCLRQIPEKNFQAQENSKIEIFEKETQRNQLQLWGNQVNQFHWCTTLRIFFTCQNALKIDISVQKMQSSFFLVKTFLEKPRLSRSPLKRVRLRSLYGSCSISNKNQYEWTGRM